MLTTDPIEEVRAWSEKIGIITPEKPSISTDFISKQCEEAHSIPMEQVEELLLKITSFNLYIKSLKGAVIAKLNHCESKIKRRLFISLSKIKVEDTQYKTREEKESMAADIDAELDKLFDEQLVLKMKLAKIKDIPYAVDSVIETIRMVYKKRLDAI